MKKNRTSTGKTRAYVNGNGDVKFLNEPSIKSASRKTRWNVNDPGLESEKESKWKRAWKTFQGKWKKSRKLQRNCCLTNCCHCKFIAHFSGLN